MLKSLSKDQTSCSFCELVFSQLAPCWWNSGVVWHFLWRRVKGGFKVALRGYWPHSGNTAWFWPWGLRLLATHGTLLALARTGLTLKKTANVTLLGGGLGSCFSRLKKGCTPRYICVQKVMALNQKLKDASMALQFFGPSYW